jgi:hypothetical protein
MSECADEEHELPPIEAVLAGTLALMTGYSQALLAELHPEHRVLMGRKIGNNLALLAEHPLLSAPFQTVLSGLHRRWTQMAGCTAEAASSCSAAPCRSRAHAEQQKLPAQTQPVICDAPPLLQ